MRKVTLEISEAAYKKLYVAGSMSCLKGEAGIADLLLFKVLDGLENNLDTVIIKAKEDR